MNHGLFRIESSGVIKATYFFQFNSSLKPPKSIFSWLTEDGIEKLKAIFKSSNGYKEVIKLVIIDSLYTAILYPIGSAYLIYLTTDAIDETKQPIIEEFMVALNQQNTTDSSSEKQSTAFYYDSIQKLNNALINKSREMEKLNQKLNQANKILNNRLVKDPLTGLVSRYQYHDEMYHEINQFPEKKGVFCFIDLDDFKLINDKYGHRVGDEFLVKFAERLKKLNVQHAIKMRISGDEFGVFISRMNKVSNKELDSLTKTLIEIVVSPIEVEGNKHQVTMSIGYAILDDDSSNIYQLIEYADFAMYQAKRKGKNQAMRFNLKDYESRSSNL